MSVQAVQLLPLVEVALALVPLFWTASARVRAVQSAGVKLRDIGMRESNRSMRRKWLANAWLSVHYYIVAIVEWVPPRAKVLFDDLARLSAPLRIGHADVHVTHNHVSRRSACSAAGAVMLWVTWVIFVVRLLPEI